MKTGKNKTKPTSQEAHLALRRAALEIGSRIPENEEEIETIRHNLDPSEAPRIPVKAAFAYLLGAYKTSGYPRLVPNYLRRSTKK